MISKWKHHPGRCFQTLWRRDLERSEGKGLSKKERRNQTHLWPAKSPQNISRLKKQLPQLTNISPKTGVLNEKISQPPTDLPQQPSQAAPRLATGRPSSWRWTLEDHQTRGQSERRWAWSPAKTRSTGAASFWSNPFVSFSKRVLACCSFGTAAKKWVYPSSFWVRDLVGKAERHKLYSSALHNMPVVFILSKLHPEERRSCENHVLESGEHDECIHKTHWHSKL